MISAGNANALSDGGNVARQWMLQALADPDVTEGMGLFVGNVAWDRADGDIVFTAFGIDAARPGFVSPTVTADLSLLQVQNAVIIDRLARGLTRDDAAAIRPQSPVRFEAQGRSLTALDTFAGGGGFGADGDMLLSDQTFLGLPPQRSSTRRITFCCACARVPMSRRRWRGSGR